jgi:shikimate dehydrogenase
MMSPDPVYTLADLERWPRSAPSLAVLGHPIRHSLSPPMHNAALAAEASSSPRLDGWRYFRFDVPPADLPRALALLYDRQFRGVNLTVPHKVMAFDLMKQIDARARPSGAVNTLLQTPDGWHGFNTDGYGLAAAVGGTLGCELSGATVLLLGAGGAARAAAVECLARRCACLWIANRTRDHLDGLLDLLRPLAGEIPVRALGSSDALPPKGAIVINATSAGLRAGDPPPIDLSLLPKPAAVFDMIYNPAQTALLAQAARLGVPAANGMSMLAHQGAKSLEIWTGIPAERSAPVMLATLRAALEQET